MKNHFGIPDRRFIARVAVQGFKGLSASLLIGGTVVMAGTSVPTKPQGMAIEASAGTLVIYWSHSVDADGAVVGYELIKNGTLQWLGNVNSHRDSAVSQGITYAYNLIAVDNRGNRSAMSDTVTYRFVTQGSQHDSNGATASGGSIGIGGGNAAACVDPDGDGWGWNGTSSCKVAISATQGGSADGGACVDEDGDGYGWNGFQSCRLDQSGSAGGLCIDSDGDGYGWDGENTCIP